MRLSGGLMTAIAVACGVASAPLTSTTAGPIVVEETARLSSPDPTLPLNGPLAMHGNTMAVGSIVADPGSGEFRCAVFVFERPSGTGAWSFTRKLTEFRVPNDREQSFLALDVTANAIGVSARGRASVFERTGSGWSEKQLVRPTSVADFPSDIAVSGTAALVGGTSDRTDGFVYRRSAAGEWPLEATLRAGPRAVSDNDYLGENLDLDGDYVAMVSPDVQSDPTGLGHMYVFNRNAAGAWLQAAVLNDPLSPESPPSDSSVSALSLGSSGLAAFRNLEGGASIFRGQGAANWAQVANVRPLDALMNRLPTVSFFDFFSPIELNTLPGPAAIAIGTPQDEDRGQGSGSVGVFVSSSDFSAWRHAVELVASDAQPQYNLGAQLAFHGDTLAAYANNRVYVFRVPSDLTQPDNFHDDFEDGEAVGWRQTSSSWSVLSSRGSRVYRQSSTSGEHVTTRSGIDWRNVAIEADIRPTAFNGSDRWVSLMTRHVDDRNYYYVSLRNTNVLRLARRVGDTFTNLGSIPLPVTVNRSYRVRLEAIGTWLRVYVDGRLRLQARDSTHQRGGIGMKTAFAAAEFDNVLVSPNPLTTLLADDFQNFLRFDWSTEPAANWSVVDVGSNRVLRQASTSGTSRATAGVEYEAAEPELANHVVEARIRATSFGSSDARFGLMARFRDNSNYTSVVLNRSGSIALRKNTNGSIQVLDSAPLAVSVGTWYTLRLETIDDRLRVYVNNALTLETRDTSVDPSNTRGRYGLLTVGAAAEFDDVRVTEP